MNELNNYPQQLDFYQKAGDKLPKIIGFLGTYTADLCLYTALVMQNTGRSVCVIDQSDDSVLYESIPTPDKRLEMVTYHNVDFIRREPYANWLDMDYEYVFVQLGTLPQEIYLAVCMECVMVIDCERVNLDFYRCFMKQNEMAMTVLLRGFCPDGISGQKIKEHFEQENCFVAKWLTLPLDQVDEAYRIRMQYEPIKKFRYLSVDMEKVLIQLLHSFGVANYAEIIHAIKAAKRGKVAGMRYLWQRNARMAIEGKG